MVYRQSTEALSEDAPLQPESPYALSKLAQEMLGARSVTEDGRAALLPRSFNHLGPRQSLTYAASSFAHQIAQIEAGRAEPVIVVGHLDARRDLTDVRDTVRAYQLLMERGVPGRILQRLLRARASHRRHPRRLVEPCPGVGEDPSGPVALPPARQPPTARRPRPDPERSRLEARDSDRAHPPRPARLLAGGRLGFRRRRHEPARGGCGGQWGLVDFRFTFDAG